MRNLQSFREHILFRRDRRRFSYGPCGENVQKLAQCRTDGDEILDKGVSDFGNLFLKVSIVFIQRFQFYSISQKPHFVGVSAALKDGCLRHLMAHAL